MWFIQPKKDYRKEIDWKYANEKELFSWQIRCRNYNTKTYNLILIISLLISSCMPLSIWFGIENSGLMTIVIGATIVLLIPMCMSVTHQTAIMVYRVTDNHIERVSWNPQIDSVRPILFIIAGISLVVILGLTAISPKFLAGVIGPAGIALLALKMGTSGSYYNLQKDFQHTIEPYEHTIKITPYPKKNIIFTTDHWFNDSPRVQKYVTTNNALFCTEDTFGKLLDYLKNKKPEAEIAPPEYLDNF